MKEKEKRKETKTAFLHIYPHSHIHSMAHMDVRRQFVGVCSLLLSCVFQQSNSDPQDCQGGPIFFPAEPSDWPFFTFL